MGFLRAAEAVGQRRRSPGSGGSGRVGSVLALQLSLNDAGQAAHLLEASASTKTEAGWTTPKAPSVSNILWLK